MTADELNRCIEEAQNLWGEGERAERNREYERAYVLYTQAHDLVIDDARYHAFAHQQLRRVNWQLNHYDELLTDWLLHAFAPLGVFKVISYFTKAKA